MITTEMGSEYPIQAATSAEHEIWTEIIEAIIERLSSNNLVRLKFDAKTRIVFCYLVDESSNLRSCFKYRQFVFFNSKLKTFFQRKFGFPSKKNVTLIKSVSQTKM